MFLLDTDTLIYSLKGEEAVVRNLEAHQQDPLKISVISLLELYYGAYKSKKRPQIWQRSGGSKITSTFCRLILPLPKPSA